MPEPLLVVKDLARDFDVSRPWLNRVIEHSPRQILKPLASTGAHESSSP